MEMIIIGIIIKKYDCSPRTGDVGQPELPADPYSLGHLSRMSG